MVVAVCFNSVVFRCRTRVCVCWLDYFVLFMVRLFCCFGSFVGLLCFVFAVYLFVWLVCIKIVECIYLVFAFAWCVG